MTKMNDDPRIDPRIKAVMGAMPPLPLEDADTRQQLLDEASTPEAIARLKQMVAMFEMVDNEEVAPSTGLEITTHEFTSEENAFTAYYTENRWYLVGPFHFGGT